MLVSKGPKTPLPEPENPPAEYDKIIEKNIKNFLNILPRSTFIKISKNYFLNGISLL